MKKNKLITISILGMLLLVPFMIPTVAAPASYVSVAEEEQHSWIMYIHFSNYVQWDTDNMSAAFTAIYGVDDFGAVRAGWGLIPTPPQAYWPVIINEINPEVTTDFLSAAFIPDNITHTPLSVTFGYNYWTGGLTWPTTWRIVNDTDSFAKQNLFGGMAISPTWVQDVQFGPNNINWATFVATANWGLGGGYWPHPLTANTTVTEITNGYQLSVPVSGYAIPGQFNNTMPITINVTYNTDGILQAYTMEYGTDLLYGYYHYQYFVDAVAPETTSPSDIVGLYNPPYTGLNITWTATDMHPENYTITRDGTPVVTTTPWVNGTPVVYNITDGLPLGNHTFEITFWDTFAHSTTDSVKFIVFVPDDIDPVLTSTPSDIVIDIGEYGDTFSWTATDDYPSTYTISRNGTMIVGPTAWVSGTPVTIDVEFFVSYTPGVTTYEVTLSDLNGNSVSDSVTVTVNPIPTATTPPPGIPGFEPLIVIGILGIGTIGLIVLKKKRK